MRRPPSTLPALGLLLLAVASCAKRAPVATRAVCEEATVVDTNLLSYLSAARARHHEANVREDDDDVPGAIAALEKLVAMPRPSASATASAPAPEIEEVLADARARLAELRVRANDVEGASRDVAEGLTHAPDTSYFRGHLLEVAGVVDEARAAAYADAGKPNEARAARARAVTSFQQAVSVQEAVIARTLDGRVRRDGGAP